MMGAHAQSPKSLNTFRFSQFLERWWSRGPLPKPKNHLKHVDFHSFFKRWELIVAPAQTPKIIENIMISIVF